MVIKKIFEGNFDEEVHSAFLKFGKGEFKDKFLVEAKKQKDKFVIKTSHEYANFFVRACLENVQGKIFVRGVIISTFDLRDEIDFEIKKISNFQGVRKTLIETEIDAEQILSLIEKYPRCFFGLSFKTQKNELKIKPKAPKSGKPSSRSKDKPQADFCSLKTNDKEIVNEILFDVQNFKEVSVSHIIKIDNIVYPKNIQNMKPEEIREKSKRQGELIRKVVVDGQEDIKREGFEV